MVAGSDKCFEENKEFLGWRVVMGEGRPSEEVALEPRLEC